MSQLQPHQQRVLEEKRELDEKILKLTQFFAGPASVKASMEESILLHEQLGHMLKYAKVLHQRIQLWSKA